MKSSVHVHRVAVFQSYHIPDKSLSLIIHVDYTLINPPLHPRSSSRLASSLSHISMTGVTTPSTQDLT
jgi:hypothetical protein